jgi:hypothetical protein
VNAGCFSSTKRGKTSTTFNEELAALLAKDGVTVYGPPYGGIVTSAYWLGQWREFGQQLEEAWPSTNAFGQRQRGQLREFSQQLEDGKTIREVPIKFERITPATRRPRRPRGLRLAKRRTTVAGTLVITND